MADTVKIAVCDDEKNIRSYLVSLIKKQDRECSITEYASADAYLSDGMEYDLIFLDIEMGGSGTDMDGMGLARHIRGMEAQKQPVTTKQNAFPEIVKEHKIGLENVRDMAERYLGGVNIKVKGEVFHVTVMLQQREVKEDK